ncbi:unnamed protein product [Caenorhabditis bovis]|uniref:BHLH domain-containing protein n=1 Tax=Caenorhabditis bovis TaxID=2654633 RepID=A0A8S1ELV4_9PELO|nr:unnamed protein product [Caenorhabditis bovis]
MDSQLSIGTLLTAARLIESHLPLATSSASGTTQFVFDGENKNELRSILSGKLKIDKKHCFKASTSSDPYCTTPPSRKSSKHSRAAHNELEKTRRANLRGCLDQLKSLVPSISDAARNTTLALLTRARDYIKELDEDNANLQRLKQLKEAENAALAAELERLQKAVNDTNSRPESCASSSYTASSPLLIEFSPSTKPHYHNDSPKPIIIDPIADGLLPAVPLTYPRPYIYPQTVLDLLELQSPKLDVSRYLPINLRV